MTGTGVDIILTTTTTTTITTILCLLHQHIAQVISLATIQATLLAQVQVLAQAI